MPRMIVSRFGIRPVKLHPKNRMAYLNLVKDKNLASKRQGIMAKETNDIGDKHAEYLAKVGLTAGFVLFFSPLGFLFL